MCNFYLTSYVCYLTGGNKVYFANMTVKFSEMWYEQGSNSHNLVDMHNKFVLQSNYCATEKVLHCHKLTSKKVLSLIQSPVQLISYLVETYSLNIEESIKGMLFYIVLFKKLFKKYD